MSSGGYPGAGPRHLAFSPAGSFVYVVNELDATVCVFAYDADKGLLGALVQVVSALPEGFRGRPWGAEIRLTPDGKRLYVSERTSSALAAFHVDPAGGKLRPIGWFATATQPRAFAIDPVGRYLVVAGELSNTVQVHAIDAATGELHPSGTYPVGARPTWIEIIAP